jgi:hypothetical protein
MDDVTASGHCVLLQSLSALTRLFYIFFVVDILAKRKEPYIIEKLLNVVRFSSQVLPKPIDYCNLASASNL